MSIRDRRLSSSDTDSSDSDHEGGSGLVDLFSFLQWRGEQLDDHPNRSPLSDLQSRSKDIKEAALHRVLNAAEQASQLRHEKSQQLHADLERLRADISKRVDSLSDSWNDTRNVRFRDKWSFVMGVTTIVTTSMALVARPEWVPLMYSALAVWYLPIRVYQYAVQKPWGYFLLDWCYVSNNLSLIYLWLAPQSVFLWTVCYCSAHGPLAFSVAAWRNSLVFHSLDKVTSVFIHLYPPLVFHSIRFLVPDQVRVRDYPAATQTSSLDLKTSIGFCFFVYAVWQAAYLYFISYRKGEKIRAGKRINSFSTMSTGKGAIGHFISSVPLLWREPFFICKIPSNASLVYSR